GAQWWAGLAISVAGAGLAWRVLRTAGPLVVAPATMAWVTSSPVDRAAWLRPQFRWLVAGAGAAVGSLALAAAALGGSGGGTGLAAAATVGAAAGAGGVALAVVAQGTPRDRAWPRRLGTVPLAAGATVALVVTLVELAGRSLP